MHVWDFMFLSLYTVCIYKQNTEVGKPQPGTGDRKVEAIINQFITGQVGLNLN